MNQSLIPHRKPCFTLGHRCGIMRASSVSYLRREPNSSGGSGGQLTCFPSQVDWDVCQKIPTNPTTNSIRLTGYVAGRPLFACRWLRTIRAVTNDVRTIDPTYTQEPSINLCGVRVPRTLERRDKSEPCKAIRAEVRPVAQATSRCLCSEV